MTGFKVTAEMRAELANSFRKMRDEARSALSEAESIGDRKEARRWASELRKIEKAISDYGLEQFSASASV